jgi:tetratricopeptide (TPR) repeat protein
MRRLIALALTLASLLLAASLGAAPSEADRRHAQVLFDRGRTLLEQGRYAEACPLFAESQRLDPGGGTLLNLALCREKEGRLATAHALYSDALSVAIKDGRDDRKQLAEERLAALEPRLPRARFELPTNVGASRLTLELDGAALPRVAWSSPFPVDPGAHAASVRAPGYVAQTVSFTALEAREVVVRFGALERPPAPPPVESRFSTASWIVGGVGVAALGTSIATGIFALNADADADSAVERAECMPSRDFCRDPRALDEAERERDRARTLAWISTGMLVVGSAAIVTAWLLPRERVVVDVGRERVGVRIEADLPALW